MGHHWIQCRGLHAANRPARAIERQRVCCIDRESRCRYIPLRSSVPDCLRSKFCREATGGLRLHRDGRCAGGRVDLATSRCKRRHHSRVRRHVAACDSRNPGLVLPGHCDGHSARSSSAYLWRFSQRSGHNLRGRSPVQNRRRETPVTAKPIPSRGRSSAGVDLRGDAAAKPGFRAHVQADPDH